MYICAPVGDQQRVSQTIEKQPASALALTPPVNMTMFFGRRVTTFMEQKGLSIPWDHVCTNSRLPEGSNSFRSGSYLSHRQNGIPLSSSALYTSSPKARLDQLRFEKPRSLMSPFIAHILHA
jgi:hypothetical protein